jgi:hypothetical protein
MRAITAEIRHHLCHQLPSSDTSWQHDETGLPW